MVRPPSTSPKIRTSPSSQRAWIESVLSGVVVPVLDVALRAEGVDRNHAGNSVCCSWAVALLAEGVDRNSTGFTNGASPVVALLAEGVDRNVSIAAVVLDDWLVALLAEGVDRNLYVALPYNDATSSPSSQRAWIEMGLNGATSQSSASPSSQRAWIEIGRGCHQSRLRWSPSSQRAWIEI